MDISTKRQPTPKRVIIVKAAARLVNRCLPTHKIVVFTK